MNEIKIGIIGTDTSHSIAFTKLINDINDPYHVPGAKVVAAYPGGSPDFPLSMNRVEGYMEKLQDDYGVRKMESPEEVAAGCDAILLESCDGRVHLEQFNRIAGYGKPVFIDKPLAITASDAQAIVSLAESRHIPLMSCSALRYAEQLTNEMKKLGLARVDSATVSGPLNVEPTQSYYFWYGIHLAEMLYAIMGPGCEQVNVERFDSYECMTGRWKDGRIGAAHCRLDAGSPYGAMIQSGGETVQFEVQPGDKPFYASLIEQVMVMFRTGQSPVAAKESLEIVRFLEAAEQSRTWGRPVELAI